PRVLRFCRRVLRFRPPVPRLTSPWSSAFAPQRDHSGRPLCTVRPLEGLLENTRPPCRPPWGTNRKAPVLRFATYQGTESSLPLPNRRTRGTKPEDSSAKPEDLWDEQHHPRVQHRRHRGTKPRHLSAEPIPQRDGTVVTFCNAGVTEAPRRRHEGTEPVPPSFTQKTILPPPRTGSAAFSRPWLHTPRSRVFLLESASAGFCALVARPFMVGRR